MPYNNPRILISLGVVGSTFAGSAMPVLGVIFSKLLTYTTAPDDILALLAEIDGKETGVILTAKEYFIT
jgi:hypothetical protein